MLQVKTAMEISTSHGLPRMVSGKPLYVRLAWLLIFLVMFCLFLRALAEFVVKYQSHQVTTSLEADSLDFKFPDVYACFENPISGSYSANIDSQSADVINARLSETNNRLRKLIADNSARNEFSDAYIYISRYIPQSLPYSMLVDILAHRKEQSFVKSTVTYSDGYGRPVNQEIEAENFYHPMFLRCFKWSLNSTWQKTIVRSGSSSGLIVTLMIDTNSSVIEANDQEIHQFVYAQETLIPLSDWSLRISDYDGSDRRAGVRVFLTPPGEYPSDFVTSFSLGPGKHHTVEIGMKEEVYKGNQFSCMSRASDVQFLNPYDQTPYSHAYSYSYCYYYEYHRQYQKLVNMSGITGPLPWPLRSSKFMLNLTGEPTVFIIIQDDYLGSQTECVANLSKELCKDKKPCSTLDYSVSISSADWPTQSSLAPFISSSIKQAWTKAKAKNLSVPVLDFLLTGNASSVASYVRSNLLKVHFKPNKVLCDRVTLSKEYGASHLVSDIGGIMGIYLGMSLLTLCELLELIYDIMLFGRSKAIGSKTKMVPSKQLDVNKA